MLTRWAGKHEDAREVLNELQRQSKQRYVSEYGKAGIHLALGDKDQAFSCLEQAYEKRCEMMTWLKIDPAFDGIRTDLRFTNLLRRAVWIVNASPCMPLASSRPTPKLRSHPRVH